MNGKCVSVSAESLAFADQSVRAGETRSLDWLQV